MTPEQFTPLNGWMLVLLDPESNLVTSGLLYRPDGAREHLLRKGTVIKGSSQWVKKKDGDYRELPCPFSPGTRFVTSSIHTDKIYYYHFRKMMGDERYILLKPEDIFLYDDPEAEGKGLDDVTLGAGW